jgi:hypothetical protein
LPTSSNLAGSGTAKTTRVTGASACSWKNRRIPSIIATLKAIADRLDVLVADLVSDPRYGDRAKLLELTRGLPPGVLRKLVKELSAARKAKK